MIYKFENIDGRINEIDEKLEEHEARISGLSEGFAIMEVKLCDIQNDIGRIENSIIQGNTMILHNSQIQNQEFTKLQQTQTQEMTKLMGIITDMAKNTSNNKVEMEKCKNNNKRDIIIALAGGGLGTLLTKITSSLDMFKN